MGRIPPNNLYTDLILFCHAIATTYSVYNHQSSPRYVVDEYTDIKNAAGMAAVLPVRPAAARDLLGDIQRAMLDFFSLLCSMPHIRPDALRLPPPEGWQDVGDSKLRAGGKTEDTINFLKHLPCLVHDIDQEKPWLTHMIQSLYFSQGEICCMSESDYLEAPGHVVFIGDAKTRNGSVLRLDTINGTLTEVTLLRDTKLLPYDEYEALPAESKWIANETLPATQWLTRERARLQHLVYIPVISGTRHREVEFYHRCTDVRAEPAFIAADSEFISSGPQDDEEFVESKTGDESDDAMSFSSVQDGEISSEELSSLRDEGDLPLALASVPDSATPPAGYLTWLLLADRVDTLPVNQEIYDIYQRNGWPSDAFDRDACERELVAWSEAKRAESVAKEEAEKKLETEEERQMKIAEMRQRRAIMDQRRKEEEAARGIKE